MFLEVCDPRAPLPDWTCFVSHRLAVVNQKSEADKSVSKESQVGRVGGGGGVRVGLGRVGLLPGGQAALWGGGGSGGSTSSSCCTSQAVAWARLLGHLASEQGRAVFGLPSRARHALLGLLALAATPAP